MENNTWIILILIVNIFLIMFLILKEIEYKQEILRLKKEYNELQKVFIRSVDTVDLIIESFHKKITEKTVKKCNCEENKDKSDNN